MAAKSEGAKKTALSYLSLPLQVFVSTPAYGSSSAPRDIFTTLAEWPVCERHRVLPDKVAGAWDTMSKLYYLHFMSAQSPKKSTRVNEASRAEPIGPSLDAQPSFRFAFRSLGRR